jgi:acyl-CoA thioester hydrolase
MGIKMSIYKPYERETFYYETDQMGIIHHSNYIRWFEEARIDFLKQIGIPYDEMERRGLLIPVLGVSCKYKKAFRYGDTFQISMKIQDFKGVKFSVAYEVYNKSTGELHATGSSEHGFVDAKLMPVNIKKLYPDIYEGFVAGIGEEK